MLTKITQTLTPLFDIIWFETDMQDVCAVTTQISLVSSVGPGDISGFTIKKRIHPSLKKLMQLLTH